MEKYREYFKNKKITVMGLGLLGRGVGDTAFLAECGAELIVTDMKTEDVLRESLNQLKDYPNITYVLGEHREEDFVGRDMILKAAGVPLLSSHIEVARKDGAEIVMSGALFARLSGIPIIGVTGTRGKSTTTHMIYHVLTQVTEGASVILGGNVRGVSNLQLLKEVEADSIAVMELDSWQLQGFGDMGISPQIAIFTNFMEDHLNYYEVGGKGHDEAMSSYFADKAQIFLHQEESGVFITTREVFEEAKAFATGKRMTIGQEVVLVDASVLPDDCLLAMPGEHNRLNAALAYEALKATGLGDEEIFEGLASFPGVPGRLEYLGAHNGVKIYNDNNSTTPTATVVGLRAVGGEETDKKKVVLIMGGDEKNLDMTPLLNEIPKWCSKVVLFKERGTDRVRNDIFAMQDRGVAVYEEEGLEATVKRALEVAEQGEVILYSPAFSSFGKHFKNEYDRNDQFVEIITSYQNE